MKYKRLTAIYIWKV